MDSPVSAKAAVLTVLAVESSCGSEIIERVFVATDERLKLHRGSIYPALAALERDALIRTRSVSGLSGGAHVYEITRKGRDLMEFHRSIFSALYFSEGPPWENRSSSSTSMAS